MNSRNNSYRGFGFYLVLILIVVGVWYFLDGNTTTNSYTRAAFEKDIQSGDVTAIDIVQNREIPTGSVNLTFSDSTQKVLIVSDVNEILSAGSGDHGLYDGECSGGELDHDIASISDHICCNVYFLHDYDQSGSGKRRRRQQQDDEFR